MKLSGDNHPSSDTVWIAMSHHDRTIRTAFVAIALLCIWSLAGRITWTAIHMRVVDACAVLSDGSDICSSHIPLTELALALGSAVFAASATVIAVRRRVFF